MYPKSRQPGVKDRVRLTEINSISLDLASTYHCGPCISPCFTPRTSHSPTSYLGGLPRGPCVLMKRPSELSLPLPRSALLPSITSAAPVLSCDAQGQRRPWKAAFCFPIWSQGCGNTPGPPGDEAGLNLLLSSSWHLLHWRVGDEYLSLLLCVTVDTGPCSLASCFQRVVTTVHRDKAQLSPILGPPRKGSDHCYAELECKQTHVQQRIRKRCRITQPKKGGWVECWQQGRDGACPAQSGGRWK